MRKIEKTPAFTLIPRLRSSIGRLRTTLSWSKRSGFTLIELPSLRTRLRRAKAFTLIELLVVISVIGLLASVILVALNSARVRARDTRRKADLNQIVKALELYYDQYGRYPPIRPSSTCGGVRDDWATSYCTESNWLTTDSNFLNYTNPPKDPRNAFGVLGNNDTPWWESYVYTYGVSANGQIYDLLTSLENEDDPDACRFKIWKSQAVWAGEPGCWSSDATGQIERADQIYSVK